MFPAGRSNGARRRLGGLGSGAGRAAGRFSARGFRRSRRIVNALTQPLDGVKQAILVEILDSLFAQLCFGCADWDEKQTAAAPDI